MAKRGRPKGTSYKDGPYLDQIADALTRDPAKSANSVIMKIAGDRGITDYQAQEAFRRRMHCKWSCQKEDRLAAAREHLKERAGGAFQQAAKNIAESAARMVHSIRPVLEQQRQNAQRIQTSMQPHTEQHQAMAARISDAMRPQREQSTRIAELVKRMQPNIDASRLEVWQRTNSVAAVLLTEGMLPKAVHPIVRPKPFTIVHPTGASALAATKRVCKTD